MPRKLRLEYPGAVYHVANRGNRDEPIFQDDSDRTLFLQTLDEACRKTGWEVYAFCLMPNHFHLVVETPQPNLVAGMKWFLGTYTGRFNRRHQFRGHLFGGRYKAVLLEGSDAGSLRSVCDYVHLNPVRARLLSPEQSLRDYPWSSFPILLKDPKERPAWLRADQVLGHADLPANRTARRAEFEREMEARRNDPEPETWHDLRQGWCHGSEAFRAKLIARFQKGHGVTGYGKPPLETGEQWAEQVVRNELAVLGWNEEDLARQPKTAAEKVRIARRLRKETVLPLRWIARRLQMGSPNTLRNELLRRAKAPPPSKPRPPASQSKPRREPVRPAIPAPADPLDMTWD